MEYRYDPIMCMNVPVSSVRDSSRGHEIVVKTENYLKSLGKNNSVGKYDRVVQGVKSLLEQGYLEGPELERAIKQETDKLLKKYDVNDSAIRGFFKNQSGKEFHKDFANSEELMNFVRSAKAVGTVFFGAATAPNDKKAKDSVYSVSYKSNGVYQSIGVVANSEAEAIAKAKEHFEKRGKVAEILGASIGESRSTMEAKGKPIIDSVLDKAAKMCDLQDTLEEVESKGQYRLTKSPSGRWAVLKNTMPIKYGMEKEMKELFVKITKTKDEKLSYGGTKRVKGGYIHFQKNNKGLYDVFYESDWNSSYNWTRYNQTEEQVIKTFTSNNEI